MSRHNLHAFAWLKAAAPLFALTVLAGAALSTSCDPDEQSDGLDKYFLRDVAAVQAMGLNVYWLGTEFTVDGVVFRGPYGFEFGPEVEGAGIEMTYVASLDGGNIDFDLDVLSRDVWDLTKEDVLNPGLPGVTRETVSVGEREGQLISVPLGTRPVNTLWLVLDLGDVVVLATAGAGGPVYPGGPDYNPFINNPDLLIQAMQDLRPYPE
jgi:hypothetical protein